MQRRPGTSGHSAPDRRTVLTTALAAACAAGGLVAAAPPAQAAVRVVAGSTAAQLTAVVPTLHAGDTLRLAPGTYEVGAWRPRLVNFGNHAAGTAAARITMTAADPAHPPLLRGALKFDGASFWTFSHLRIQGTIHGTDTLTFNAGTGWQLLDSEIFGARMNGALGNVVVARIGSWAMPTNWTISGNAIHDGGANPKRPGQQHEIYVTAQGNARNARITRNALFNTSQGAGVKLGSGGGYNSAGVSGVEITNNTMFNNFEQVLLHGQVSNTLVRGNLMIFSTRRQHDGSTVGIYLAGLTGKHNVLQNNYFFKVSKPVYNNASRPGSFSSIGNRAARPNPDFDSAVSWMFHPGDVNAQRYGVYSLINFSS